MRRLLPLILLNVACAAAPTPAAVAPSQPTPAPAPSSEQPEKPGVKNVAPAAVPPPPASCAELVAHPTGCNATGPLHVALGEALVKEDVVARDAALACLESR